MKYIFSNDPSGNYCKKVELKNGNDRLFVCWLYPEDVKEGETKSQAVDRLMKEAEYESREDFWNHKMK
jgi:hypothetical protein